MSRGKPAPAHKTKYPMTVFGIMEREEEKIEPIQKNGKSKSSRQTASAPATMVVDDNTDSMGRGKTVSKVSVVGKPPVKVKSSLKAMDEQIEKDSRKAVMDSTAVKYESKIFSLKKWMIDVYGKENGDRPMEELDFRRFLVSGKDGKGIRAPSSIKVWRAAWGFWQDIDPEHDIDFNPNEARRTKRLIKGLRYNAGEGVEVDAADPIDSGRLWKMVDLLLDWKEAEYALYYVMVFYGAFRTNKAMNIKVKDVRTNTATGTLIFTDRMKALQASNIGKVGLKQNFKSVNNLAAFLEECMKGKDPEDLLFDVKEKKANDLLKRVAAAHHWGEGKWVVYSLRHGMALEAGAALEATPPMETIKKAVESRNTSKRMGHTNEGSKKAYQRTKTKGVKKKRKMQGKRRKGKKVSK